MANLQAAADAFNAALNYAQKNPEVLKSKYVDIYIREVNGSREIRIPWLPDKINYKSGKAVVGTFDIIKKGPVDVPLGVELKELSWDDGIFPGVKRTDTSIYRVSNPQAPEYYHNLIEEWKQKGTLLNVLVTCYPINFDCYIADYNGVLTGAFGDIEYKISLKEQKTITIKSTTEESDDGSASTGEDTKRPAEKTETYTIKSGDSMWSIAQQYMGDGSKWQSLYEANKDVLDKTAAEMGHSSNDGTWIFPGTTITIPQS